MSKQYHIGHESQQWHSQDDSREEYWCGSWGSKTPLELKNIAEALLLDLETDHPEVFLGITRKQYLQYGKDTIITHHKGGRVTVSDIQGRGKSTAPNLMTANKVMVDWWLKWTQEEAKTEELTLEQICKELGREVKIVK